MDQLRPQVETFIHEETVANRLRLVTGLEALADEHRFRAARFDETPEQYAESLADHIARRLVN